MTENTEQQQQQMSEIEQAALSHGWKPKDQWDGDPEEWVDAKEFMKRSEYLGRISKQSHRIRQLENALREEAIGRMQAYEAGYQKAKRELQELRKEALEKEDVDAVKMLDEKLENLENQATQERMLISKDVNDKIQILQKQEIPPEVLEFISQNQWYEENTVMRAAANAALAEIRYNNPDISIGEALRRMKEVIKREFPHKFENSKRKEAARVDAGSSSSTSVKSSGNLSEADLDETEKAIMHRYVNELKLMSKEKYLQELEKVKNKRG